MTQPTHPGTPGKAGASKVLIIVLVIVGVVVLGCCGGITTCMLIARHAAQSVQESIKQDMRSRGVSVGGVTEGGTEAKLPDNFPSDVPVYSGLRPTVSVADRAHDAGSVGFISSSASSSDVVSFYHDKMKSGGWTEDTNLSVGSTTTLAYSQGASKVTVSVTASGGQTMVQIVYMKK